MRRLWGYAGLVLLMTALPLLAISQMLPLREASYWAKATEVTGQIVGFTAEESGKRPLVSFVELSGVPYVFEADTYQAGMRMGQMVTVRYYLEPHLQAALKTNLSGIQLALGIAGCMLMAMSFASLLIQMRKSSMRKQLFQYGTRYEATVTGIDRKRNVRINGQSPIIVFCTMRNPQGIGERALKSAWVLKPSPELRIGGKVPVLLDPYRPRQYLVLAEEAAPFSDADDASL